MRIQTLAEWQGRVVLAGYKFRCPVCGNVAHPKDFRSNGDEDGQRAAQECIGRMLGATEFKTYFQGPCNFAAFGLFQFGETVLDPEDATKIVGVMPPDDLVWAKTLADRSGGAYRIISHDDGIHDLSIGLTTFEEIEEVEVIEHLHNLVAERLPHDSSTPG